MEAFKPFLAKIAYRRAAEPRRGRGRLRPMLSGDATPAQIGAFLMGLRVRGETLDEITGAVSAMRAQNAAGRGAARRDRHRRHRRRRRRHL